MTKTAAPAIAATTAIRITQRLFFFSSGSSSSPLAAATAALPRLVASTTTGVPAAALSTSLSLGNMSSDTLPRAASTAGRPSPEPRRGPGRSSRERHRQRVRRVA